MNNFRIEQRLQKAACLGVLVLTLGACNETSTGASPGTGESNINEGVTGAQVVKITLPEDTSRFLPGPNFPLADGTPCLACHSPAQVSNFTSLPQGPNFKLVNEQCRNCHSADYTSSQPPLDRVGWQKVVTKMVDKFGAQDIKPAHQPLMLDYLVAVYGK